jgi:hypothetical protein
MTLGQCAGRPFCGRISFDLSVFAGGKYVVIHVHICIYIRSGIDGNQDDGYQDDMLEFVSVTPSSKRRQNGGSTCGRSDEESEAASGTGATEELDEDEDSDAGGKRNNKSKRGGPRGAKRRSASEPARPAPKRGKGKTSCMKCLKTEKDISEFTCLSSWRLYPSSFFRVCRRQEQACSCRGVVGS